MDKKLKKTMIYLAGKIEPNGWRQAIFDMRNTFIGGADEYDYFKHIAYLYDDKRSIGITGPFFLSCDHSCYHGDGSHGVGRNRITGCGCYGERLLTGKEVVDICKEQIENSNLIFAYIDDDTCYGSLFEIGYAKALNKEIVVVFDTEKRKNDMWFIAKNADYSISLEEYKTLSANPLLFNTNDSITKEFIEKIIDWRKNNERTTI